MTCHPDPATRAAAIGGLRRCGAITRDDLLATFADGSGFVYEFPDLPSQETYSLLIPAPGAGIVLALAGALGARRRR